MNVYLYGGNNRFNASISLVKNNEQVKVGETYTIDSAIGMLLVAYPNQDVDTEFEFVYTLVPKIIPVPEVEKIYGELDTILQYEYAILALFVVLVLISICLFCLCKKKNQGIKWRPTTHVKMHDEEKGNVTSTDKVNEIVINFDG